MLVRAVLKLVCWSSTDGRVLPTLAILFYLWCSFRNVIKPQITASLCDLFLRRTLNGIYDKMRSSKGAIAFIVSLNLSSHVGQSRCFFRRGVLDYSVYFRACIVCGQNVTFDESRAFKGSKCRFIYQTLSWFVFFFFWGGAAPLDYLCTRILVLLKPSCV